MAAHPPVAPSSRPTRQRRKARSPRWFNPVSLTAWVFGLLCLGSQTASQGEDVNQAQLTAQAQATPGFPWLQRQPLNQGNQIAINGRLMTSAWRRWEPTANPGTTSPERFGVQDFALARSLSLSLGNTNNPTQQPLDGWDSSNGSPLTLPAQIMGGMRYLDITPLLQQTGWQVQADGMVLRITTRPATISAIRQNSPRDRRIVFDLDRPIPYQLNREGNTVTLTLAADIAPPVLQLLRSSIAPTPFPRQPEAKQAEGSKDSPEAAIDENLEPDPPVASPTLSTPALPFQITNSPNLTTLTFTTANRPRISTLSNPHRLVVDLQPVPLPPRDLQWAQGIRWQQQVVTLGVSRFPVNWLTVDLRQRGLTMRPVWNNPDMLPGTNPLSFTAQRLQVAAAINAGFFNRNNQTPLGAIRRDGRWLSSPILNRGAIAWDDAGNVRLDRLSLQETVTTPTGQRWELRGLNTGFVSAGLSRYSPDWGNTYAPFTRNEIIITVQNNQVVSQQSVADPNNATFAIPTDGYLLIVRRDLDVATAFPVGTTLQLSNGTTPSDFDRYPHIIGAGPLLLLNRQIVLNPKGESFQPAFIQQQASRSAIGVTADGRIVLVAVHNRIGGRGPSLAEMAQLMQQLGAVSALNLDGGSSTSLYLGGQLLDRPNQTAARVHNGIGIFLP